MLSNDVLIKKKKAVFTDVDNKCSQIRIKKQRIGFPNRSLMYPTVCMGRVVWTA